MLKLRIITALVLLPIVLGGLFLLERQNFSLLAGAFFLAAGWEWTAMAGRPPMLARVLWLLVLAALMVAVEHWQPVWLLTWLPLVWLGALALVLSYPSSARLWRKSWQLSLIGFLLLLLPWAAMVQIQAKGALGLPGAWALLFILLWVWAADTGAYFAGRAFGKNKLAAKVSPGKTSEGLLGGVVLALILVALVAWLAPLSGDPVLLLGVALVTVLASALGDLFESMVKREAGVKDSGTMLPGHGGMLDRLDSVTAALPVALMMLTQLGLPGGL